MREFTKSMGSYFLAGSLFGLKQMQNIFTPRQREQRKSPATHAFDSVTHATADQFGETLRSTFRMMDNLQRGMVDLGFAMMFPFMDSSRRDSSWNRRSEHDSQHEREDIRLHTVERDYETGEQRSHTIQFATH